LQGALGAVAKNFRVKSGRHLGRGVQILQSQMARKRRVFLVRLATRARRAIVWHQLLARWRSRRETAKQAARRPGRSRCRAARGKRCQRGEADSLQFAVCVRAAKRAGFQCLRCWRREWRTNPRTWLSAI